MARIIYGVAGEGSGHSSRAREIMGHLQRRGQDLQVVTYGQGVRNLAEDFPVFETEGLYFAAADNQVQVVRTVLENLKRLPRGGRRAAGVRRLFKDFRPDCVITDFEPMTAYFATHYNLPLISIDNQHRMRYMKYPCPAHLRSDALAAETVIRAMVPRPDVSLITTFYFGEVRNNRTFLFPPILRREILQAETHTGRHILVYLTRGFNTLLDLLPLFPRERFVVYGSGREGRDGNRTYKAPGREEFLKDLVSCRAVIATAGFTLMTEALHLGKPYLALPMRGQFEQELNGLLLADLGYGRNCRRTTKEAVGYFLYRLPEFRRRLRSYRRSDNSAIKKKLDELLTEGCAAARAFHRRRQGRKKG